MKEFCSDSIDPHERTTSLFYAIVTVMERLAKDRSVCLCFFFLFFLLIPRNIFCTDFTEFLSGVSSIFTSNKFRFTMEIAKGCGQRSRLRFREYTAVDKQQRPLELNECDMASMSLLSLFLFPSLLPFLPLSLLPSLSHIRLS
jgi:hypothetical protein